MLAQRAEIFGLIGSIPMKGEGQQRFKLRYIHTPEFVRQINQVAEGTGDALLTISCAREELDQFDVDQSREG
jgi:hypothetical protein